MRGKPDANQAEIVAALREIGVPVRVLSRYPGILDLIVGYRGKLYWLEVKDEKGKLTKAEQEVFDLFQGYRVYIVRSIDDALKIIGAIE